MDGGVLAGFPLVDIRAVLYDGTYHDVDSSEMAFKIAARHALKDAVEQASPVILEPVMDLTVMVDQKISNKISREISSQKFSLAKKTLQGALAKEPENITLLLDIGFVLANLGEFEAARKHYQHVVELVPESASGFAGLGFTYRLEGNFEKALQKFQHALSITPENDMVYYEIAEINFELEKLPEALKFYRMALKYCVPEMKAEIQHRIAQTHLGLNQPDKAMEIGNKILEKDPDFISVNNILGVAAYMQEDWAKAVQFFSQYCEKIPDDEAAQNLLKDAQLKLSKK